MEATDIVSSTSPSVESGAAGTSSDSVDQAYGDSMPQDTPQKLDSEESVHDTSVDHAESKDNSQFKIPAALGAVKMTFQKKQNDLPVKDSFNELLESQELAKGTGKTTPTEDKPENQISTCGDKEAIQNEATSSSKGCIDNAKKEKPGLTKGQKKVPYLSPAQMLKQAETPIPYKEPAWGGTPKEQYSFEVIKNGVVVDTIELNTKSYHIFGRLPSCDVTMEHPSLSRHHAVVQYCANSTPQHEVGWYLYDLDSTHGSWVNKVKVKPRVYVRLHVGHVVKLGGSTRLNILQGPEEDKEEESELSLTEMKELRAKQQKEADLLKQTELQAQEQKQLKLAEQQAQQSAGCGWGIDEDAEEEEDETNPFSLTEPQNEDLYIDDPKKCLRGYFEREGYDLPEYEAEEVSYGKHKCRVEVPVENQSEPMVAEATVSGKKKEAVIACALEACRLLDRLGVLRKATHESRARKKKNWEENDFYDSDEDTFLDRTGDIEKKRQKRMKRVGKETKEAETYESLTLKMEEVEKQIKEMEETLEKSKAEAQAYNDEEGLDAIDAFMESLKTGTTLDTRTKMKIKRELFELKQQRQKLAKLINIAKPSLPKLMQEKTSGPKRSSAVFIGKMKTSHQRKPIVPIVTPKVTSCSPDDNAESEEEEEEEEDEETKEKDNNSATTTAVSAVVSSGDRMDCSVRTEELKRSKVTEVSGNKVTVLKSHMRPKHTSYDPDHGAMDTSVPGIPPTGGGGKTEHSAAAEGQKKRKNEEKIEKLKKPRSLQVLDEDAEAQGEKYGSNTDDPDYAMWMPPSDQSGDGKTKLNEKYGY